MTPRKEVPPIPPNCDLFWQQSREGFWWITLGGNNYSFRPCGFDGCVQVEQMKRVAACVAAQHWALRQLRWKRLMERIMAFKFTDRHDHYFDRYYRYGEAKEEAFKNAELWLAWGGLAPQKGAL